jgi:hypothetical protein
MNNDNPSRGVFVQRAFAICAVALWLSASCPQSFAQKHVEVGIFLDYLNISQTNTNNFGLGGRFGYRIHRKIVLEGEVAYDYGINFDEAFNNISTGNIAAIQHTSVGVTHGLFGPKLQPAKERGFHPFLTLKAGFMDFRLSPSLLPLPPAASTLLGLRTSHLNPTLYPAAGIEPSLGPLGLRLEFGDEIYFNNGAHNNLRIAFGPILRF